MKKLAICAVLSFAGLFAPQANAQRGCSNSDLTGVYSFVASGIPWTGTYAVNSNCTATKAMSIPGLGTVHFFITAGADFTALRFIATDATTVISGTAQKQ